MLFFVDWPYLLIILPIGVFCWPILWPILAVSHRCEQRLERVCARKVQRCAPLGAANYFCQFSTGRSCP